MTIDKRLIEALNDPNTIVLVLDGGIDAQIAERWLRKHAPKVEQDARLYDTLELPHMQASMQVMAVFRDPSTPAVAYHENGQGAVLSRPRPDSDTFAEIVVSEPVKVGDYWVRDNPRQPGKPDLHAFMQAMHEAFRPYRLDYIDKGNQTPSKLKLRTL